jgi:hypothetical protein
VARLAGLLKIAPHNGSVATTLIRDYPLSRAVRVRLVGALVVTFGVALLAAALLAAITDVPSSVVAGLAVLAVVAVAATALLLGRGRYVVRLDDTGYRVRFVRGVGRSQARWVDVSDLTTAVVSGTPCVVLRLRDGASSTIPVNLIEGDREAFVEELQRRLDAGHGYRRL